MNTRAASLAAWMLFAGVAFAGDVVRVGDTREKVIQVLGIPLDTEKYGNAEMLGYRSGFVMLKDGHVKEITIPQSEPPPAQAPNTNGATLNPGDTREKTLEVLGQPTSIVRMDNKEHLVYAHGGVDLHDGKIVLITIPAAEMKPEAQRTLDDWNAMHERAPPLDEPALRLLREQSAPKPLATIPTPLYDESGLMKTATTGPRIPDLPSAPPAPSAQTPSAPLESELRLMQEQRGTPESTGPSAPPESYSRLRQEYAPRATTTAPMTAPKNDAIERLRQEYGTPAPDVAAPSLSPPPEEAYSVPVAGTSRDTPGVGEGKMTNTVFDALFLLFRVFIVYVVYSAAKHLASESKCHKAKAYLWAIGVAAVLAGMSWANYGTHTEDADPLYGGGETVVDFEPTKDQMNRHGMFIFTVLAVTSLVGTYQGLRKRKIQEV